MGLSPESKARFNLSRASVLVLEENPLAMSILVQILTGFGAKAPRKCKTVEQAEQAVRDTQLDLLIVDAMGHSGGGYEFVRWLRRSGIQPNCYAPVLLTSGHTPSGAVHEARDCGAHFIMAKPLTPITVLERIIWICRDGRKFVECDTYVGPDRRFRTNGLPKGITGRRREDLAADQAGTTLPDSGTETAETADESRRVQV